MLRKMWTCSVFAAVVMALSPLVAEERSWFGEPRLTQVTMIKHVFRSPTSAWADILKQHEDDSPSANQRHLRRRRESGSKNLSRRQVRLGSSSTMKRCSADSLGPFDLGSTEMKASIRLSRVAFDSIVSQPETTLNLRYCSGRYGFEAVGELEYL